MRNARIKKLMKRFFEEGFQVMDTETTGLSKHDQVIELGIINHNGATLFIDRFKPNCTISSNAEDVHGISMDDLDSCAPMSRYYNELCLIMKGRRIFAHNVDFDTRMLRQTIGKREMFDASFHCSMRATSLYLCKRRKVGVKEACNLLGVEYNAEGAHSAIVDCRMTLDILKAIAEGK